MRSLTLVLGTALLLAACGGAATPSATAAAPANKLTFTADLKPENEVPPIADAEKSGSGKATVTFDLTRDGAGKITAAKASIDVTFSGFPSTAAIQIGHIHQAPAGQNGAVKVAFKTDADNPIPLTGGAGTFSKKDVTVDPDLMQQILDTPAGFYVNFHTKANAGGVARGQLVKM